MSLTLQVRDPIRMDWLFLISNPYEHMRPFQNSLFSPFAPANLRLELVQFSRSTRIIGLGSPFFRVDRCFASTEVSV